jgi:hypothetical protein
MAPLLFEYPTLAPVSTAVTESLPILVTLSIAETPLSCVKAKFGAAGAAVSSVKLNVEAAPISGLIDLMNLNHVQSLGRHKVLAQLLPPSAIFWLFICGHDELHWIHGPKYFSEFRAEADDCL